MHKWSSTLWRSKEMHEMALHTAYKKAKSRIVEFASKLLAIILSGVDQLIVLSWCLSYMRVHSVVPNKF